jgi:hypothetical protein
MLVLRVLQSGPLHGYAIAQRIHALSTDVLQVEEGSLYPALQRILIKGWGQGTVGRIGDEPAGSLLSAHAGRARAGGARDGGVRAHQCGDSDHAPDCLTEATWVNCGGDCGTCSIARASNASCRKRWMPTVS